MKKIALPCALLLAFVFSFFVAAQTPIAAHIAPNSLKRLENRAANFVRECNAQRAAIEAQPPQTRAFIKRAQSLFEQAQGASQWDIQRQLKFESDLQSLIQDLEDLDENLVRGGVERCNLLSRECYRRCANDPDYGCNYDCMLDEIGCRGSCFPVLGSIFKKLL
jgi:hypothetical protein